MINSSNNFKQLSNIKEKKSVVVYIKPNIDQVDNSGTNNNETSNPEILDTDGNELQKEDNKKDNKDDTKIDIPETDGAVKENC